MSPETLSLLAGQLTALPRPIQHVLLAQLVPVWHPRPATALLLLQDLAAGDVAGQVALERLTARVRDARAELNAGRQPLLERLRIDHPTPEDPR